MTRHSMKIITETRSLWPSNPQTRCHELVALTAHGQCHATFGEDVNDMVNGDRLRVVDVATGSGETGFEVRI